MMISTTVLVGDTLARNATLAIEITKAIHLSLGFLAIVSVT